MKAGFGESVRRSPPLAQHVKKGLQALSKADRDCVKTKKASNLTGSINIDDALKSVCPNDPRWDYAIGHRVSTGTEVVHWIEVHPATDGQTKSIENKLDWLKSWMTANAVELGALPCKYIWISSGRTRLTKTSPGLRRLAQRGCLHVGSVYALD